MQLHDRCSHALRRVERRMRAGVMLACGVLVITGAAAQSADFGCASGDVACLIAAITQANANGESNTIRLEAGTYSLTEIDNNSPQPSFDGNGLPVIVGTVAIGGSAAEATIIERADYFIPAPPPFRIFHVAATGRLLLDGVTVRGETTG